MKGTDKAVTNAVGVYVKEGKREEKKTCFIIHQLVSQASRQDRERGDKTEDRQTQRLTNG